MDLKQRARTLRKEQTDAERKLWFHLRGRRLNGCKFKRQYPLSPYIVDFIALEEGLIIEVDGGQHVEQQEYDGRRSAFLEESGYRVLRFWNDEVFMQTEVVLEVILRALEDG